MKRILGMVVALAAVLAYSSAAAAVTFDLSGVTGSWTRSGDANAAVPGPPYNGGPCTPGMASTLYGAGSPNCFRYEFLPGSSVSIDIVGSNVSMLGGTLLLHVVQPLLLGTINLDINAVTTIYGATAYTPAAYGTLVGDNILWATPANISTVGTINCTGFNCTAISHPGFPIPLYPYLNQVSGTTDVTALVLGEWDLDALHATILGSTNAIAEWSNSPNQNNRRFRALTFGPNHLGNPVPEPASAALVLLSLVALALRSAASWGPTASVTKRSE